MPERVSLTPTSYVVLGLVAKRQPVTSYELKQQVADSIGYFWPFPHSQLYAEPLRLEDAGLLASDVEASGRKRRRYTITPAGRVVLGRWLHQGATEPTEIRDLGLLKLFFASMAPEEDRRALAAEQHRGHEERHREYVLLRERFGDGGDVYEMRTLQMGLLFEETMIAFWRELEEG